MPGSEFYLSTRLRSDLGGALRVKVLPQEFTASIAMGLIARPLPRQARPGSSAVPFKAIDDVPQFGVACREF